MSVLRVSVVVGEDESQAARVDMFGALDASSGKAATTFVLPGHESAFFVHSGINLRVSSVSTEQAMLAIGKQAVSKAKGE